MATNRSGGSARPRRDSIESTASLWEKFYERLPQGQQDAPFATDENYDSIEQNPTLDDCEENDTDLDIPPSISASLSSLTLIEPSKPWENSIPQDHLIIIINDTGNSDKVKRSLRSDFSKQGLTWKDDEEEIRPWHFGLTAIHLEFTKPKLIDIPMLILSSAIPFWLKLRTEKQKPMLKDNMPKKAMFYALESDLDVALHCGAFNNLNQFQYSPQHSWKDIEDSKWSFFLDDQRNGIGHIEWIIQNSQLRRKKQLLLANINHSIIVDSHPEGFDIYICQKCNMNEFEANARMKQKNDNDLHRNQNTDKPRPNKERKSQYRSNSRHRPAPLLCPEKNKVSHPQRIFYEFYRRIGIHPPGCYFPTIQFSVHINPFRLTRNDQRTIQNRMKQTLAILIEFFLAHRIAVCYGKINSDPGPRPHLFFQQNIPHFPSLIMKYSWQMLSTNGYRLQLQIDDDFRQRLFEIHLEEENADELFYRVCVYLSRIFSLKPFLNINQELEHAIDESKRKRGQSAYDLVRKLDFQGDNEVYVPSVTITPTTIRVKPLKLCRTNRVLRATKEFGEAVEHFVLVDVRDENGRDIQSYHFGHLRLQLLGYLNDGFTLMDDNRQYQYLHHSQSQLRERQFWFYHHEPNGINLSFDEAYAWMGNFDKEKNPAKHAARIALCFSTTKATVQVTKEHVLRTKDIKIEVNKKELLFTDGCGTMSIKLRNRIKKNLGMYRDFSAVQFRYDGAKGVVSVHPDMPQNIHLCIRDSMKKFESNHECFEVCKISAPRPLFLNRQAILLLSYRKVPDASFLILQQQNHLALIRALLRNIDAEKLILQKIPSWLLPRDIHYANINYIHEPFFRQLLISSCLQSMRDLLQRTRIRVPPNEGRNMIGIVDEYNVLEANQVYIQYTILNRDSHDNDNNNNNKTEILNNCRVVITKNPCHHPGDIRTFTAVDHPRLEHLKDVIVFSQQGDRPAPHDISGSDLDGDEYLVIWHKDLVPYSTENAPPYDYDACTPLKEFDACTPPKEVDDSVTRDHINNIILDIAEQDCLGRLSNLHLAFADKFGIDNDKRPAKNVLSTVELAGAISQEVDSGKTGYHPVKEKKIKELNNALGNQRPDFMDNPNFEQYESKHILGKLYRASKKTIPGWNRLVRYHRHLRHLKVRTRDEPDEDAEEEQTTDNDDETGINLDESLLSGVNFDDVDCRDCVEVARQLAFVYRQEIFEILNLYGLSHESDLWCRNSTAGISGELEDTAYTELEQLVNRTKNRFFLHQVTHCTDGKCDDYTAIPKLCGPCKKRQQAIVVACYQICYGSTQVSDQAPILSLSWLFTTPLLQNRINQESVVSSGLLIKAIGKALDDLITSKHRLRLNGVSLQFKTLRRPLIGEANVDMSVFAFIEVLQECIGSRNYPRWSLILSRFVRRTPSFRVLNGRTEPSDEWELISQPHKIDDYDEYIVLLMSVIQPDADELMHEYFQNILDICFEEGRRINDIDFLNISENILLLLQKMAINETII